MNLKLAGVLKANITHEGTPIQEDPSNIPVAWSTFIGYDGQPTEISHCPGGLPSRGAFCRRASRIPWHG